ncbi:uncharacterized protein LOC131956947 [Physella acuta]|uniref:uncharacterized protein LOC131956947 n=1 Tax=Physella acuta TaxID=109671 RepID=UPI0027DCC351|nr:uncharacterized protein LOC131956947 [Physella acuta]
MTEAEYSAFKLQTRKEYEHLIYEFELRCHKNALINNHEASTYARRAYLTEIVAAIMGAFAVTSLGVWLAQKTADYSVYAANWGYLGIFAVGVAFVLQFISKGSERVLPSFSKRAEGHIKAAGAWQMLAQKAMSYRIRLDNPTLDVKTYAEWYDDLITQKEELNPIVISHGATFQKYDDPEVVYNELKKRKMLLIRYKELDEANKVDNLAEKL